MATPHQLARSVELTLEFKTRDYRTFASDLHAEDPEAFAMLLSALERFKTAKGGEAGAQGEGRS